MVMKADESVSPLATPNSLSGKSSSMAPDMKESSWGDSFMKRFQKQISIIVDDEVMSRICSHLPAQQREAEDDSNAANEVVSSPTSESLPSGAETNTSADSWTSTENDEFASWLASQDFDASAIVWQDDDHPHPNAQDTPEGYQDLASPGSSEKVDQEVQDKVCKTARERDMPGSLGGDERRHPDANKKSTSGNTHALHQVEAPASENLGKNIKHRNGDGNQRSAGTEGPPSSDQYVSLRETADAIPASSSWTSSGIASLWKQIANSNRDFSCWYGPDRNESATYSEDARKLAACNSLGPIGEDQQLGHEPDTRHTSHNQAVSLEGPPGLNCESESLSLDFSLSELSFNTAGKNSSVASSLIGEHLLDDSSYDDLTSELAPMEQLSSGPLVPLRLHSKNISELQTMATPKRRNNRGSPLTTRNEAIVKKELYGADLAYPGNQPLSDQRGPNASSKDSSQTNVISLKWVAKKKLRRPRK